MNWWVILWCWMETQKNEENFQKLWIFHVHRFLSLWRIFFFWWIFVFLNISITTQWCLYKHQQWRSVELNEIWFQIKQAIKILLEKTTKYLLMKITINYSIMKRWVEFLTDLTFQKWLNIKWDGSNKTFFSAVLSIFLHK
jgi:hypothetical protein